MASMNPKPKGPRAARFVLAAGAALLALATGRGADAQPYQAYVTYDAPLMSGPSPDYPAVADLSAGQPVTVYGCLDGYTWCDIQADYYRGWFDAGLLAYYYEDQPVPFYNYAYQIGLPIIGFSFYDYWGRFYHDRPFFGERERWGHIAPAPRGAIAQYRGPRVGFGPRRPEGGFGRPDFDHREFGRPEGGRPEFRPEGGRPDFHPEAGRQDFRPDAGHPEAARPGFTPPPGGGRPEFNRPDYNRPEFNRPQAPPAPQQAPQAAPQMQRPPGGFQGGQPPRPQFAPQMQRPQGGPPPQMQRPQGGPPPQQPHPQGPPPGQPHPQGGGGGQQHPQQGGNQRPPN